MAEHPTVPWHDSPGRLADLTLTLASGRYSLWCSIANHRQLGMRATLLVTAR
jgi:uncharacterized cupredoxin-like copper-binding protein